VTQLAHTGQGEVSIAPGALHQIVVQAAQSVDGARVRRLRRGLDVEIAANRCRVSLVLAAPYGTQLAELGEAVQESVAGALRRMCEVDVEAVDVAIEELT
jgi:uncharacterized alkaline shock family protein YloU